MDPAFIAGPIPPTIVCAAKTRSIEGSGSSPGTRTSSLRCAIRVKELLRCDGPVQRTGRIPNEDVAYGGRTIGKGEPALLFIGAADRDPAQFPDPDRLDITRTDNRHIRVRRWGIHFVQLVNLVRRDRHG
jgi:hypothetical protein